MSNDKICPSNNFTFKGLRELLKFLNGVMHGTAIEHQLLSNVLYPRNNKNSDY